MDKSLTDYLQCAAYIVEIWIDEDYPMTVQGDGNYMNDIPTPFLVVRPIDSGSCVVVPEVHFYHCDGSLLIVKCTPWAYAVREWEQESYEFIDDRTPDDYKDAEQAAAGAMQAWIDEGYFVCCGRYSDDPNLGKVYTHGYESTGDDRTTEHNRLRSAGSGLFPSLSYGYEHPKGWFGSVAWQPIAYHLDIGGLYAAHDREQDGVKVDESPSIVAYMLPARYADAIVTRERLDDEPCESSTTGHW